MVNQTSLKKGFFGAFIMTFERPKILMDSISALKSQTFPPEYILVIDNSNGEDTRKIINNLSDPTVGYHKVGYNSGPAGAAGIGLHKLTEMGFQWIYWGDDDNPPRNKQIFENFFSKIERYVQENDTEIGVFGGRGGNLNKITGRISSLTNGQLQKSDVVDVDLVPGGHTMLVNAEVVKSNIAPEEKLFFGFEELDFCLKVKESGFRVLVDAENWLREHIEQGYFDTDYKWKGSSFGNPMVLWRDYYSTRNLLYIFYKNNYFLAFLFLFLKSMFKSIAGFSYGHTYGKRNFAVQWDAILHFLIGRYGEKRV